MTDRLSDFMAEHKVNAELVATAFPVKTVSQSAARGEDPKKIFKSLIFMWDRPILVLVRGDMRADEGKLSQTYPGLHFANANEVRATTGYGPGEVPPLLEGDYVRIMDAAVAQGDVFECGGGKEMRHLRIRVAELKKLFEWKILDIAYK